MARLHALDLPLDKTPRLQKVRATLPCLYASLHADCTVAPAVKNLLTWFEAARQLKVSQVRSNSSLRVFQFKRLQAEIEWLLAQIQVPSFVDGASARLLTFDMCAETQCPDRFLPQRPPRRQCDLR